jgi:Txe/YoeB family toxin of Txe-Axe toxin-antitoxin module
VAQRNLLFTPGGWEDYTYWLSQDKKTLNKINTLIKDFFGSLSRYKIEQ